MFPNMNFWEEIRYPAQLYVDLVNETVVIGAKRVFPCSGGAQAGAGRGVSILELANGHLLKTVNVNQGAGHVQQSLGQLVWLTIGVIEVVASESYHSLGGIRLRNPRGGIIDPTKMRAPFPNHGQRNQARIESAIDNRMCAAISFKTGGETVPDEHNPSRITRGAVAAGIPRHR